MRAKTALLRRLIGTSLAAMCVTWIAAAAQDWAKLSTTVQSEVSSLVRALYQGDVEAFLTYSHPNVIESLGGGENARVAASELLSRIRASGVDLEAIEFPEPPRFVKGDSTLFVLVPTLIRVIAKGGVRAESRNFQVGLLEPGASTWTFVEGSRLTPSNMDIMLPGFPSGVEMPPISRRKLE